MGGNASDAEVALTELEFRRSRHVSSSTMTSSASELTAATVVASDMCTRNSTAWGRMTALRMLK